ncbi:Mediator of RNA polymerase II transcription subunit 21, partial [Erysiphe neolycopersici]
RKFQDPECEPQEASRHPMADRLTQLQDALDQVQFRPTSVEKKPQKLAPTDIVRQESNNEVDQKQNQSHVDSLPDDVFRAAQLELARDLIIKEQQIEALISVLPGLENSEKDQEDTLRQLDAELKGLESKRNQAFIEKQNLIKQLDEIITSIKRP